MSAEEIKKKQEGDLSKAEPDKSVEARKPGAFDSIQTFEELYRLIEAMGKVEGKNNAFSAGELRGIIEGVRKGEMSIFDVTRTEGLRLKVDDLIKAEQKAKKEIESHSFSKEKISEAIGEAKSISDLLNVIERIPGLQGSNHLWTKQELRDGVIAIMESTASVRDLMKNWEEDSYVYNTFLNRVPRAAGLRKKVFELLKGK